MAELKCPECGELIWDEKRVCPACGAQLPDALASGDEVSLARPMGTGTVQPKMSRTQIVLTTLMVIFLMFLFVVRESLMHPRF